MNGRVTVFTFCEQMNVFTSKRLLPRRQQIIINKTNHLIFSHDRLTDRDVMWSLSASKGQCGPAPGPAVVHLNPELKRWSVTILETEHGDPSRRFRSA